MKATPAFNRFALSAVLLVSLVPLFIGSYDDTTALNTVFSHCAGADVVYETSTHMAINADVTALAMASL